MNIEYLKTEALQIIGVSLGFVTGSLLLSIGLTLCLTSNWIGVIPVIAGYEFIRYMLLFLLSKYFLFQGVKK